MFGENIWFPIENIIGFLLNIKYDTRNSEAAFKVTLYFL